MFLVLEFQFRSFKIIFSLEKFHATPVENHTLLMQDRKVTCKV